MDPFNKLLRLFIDSQIKLSGWFDRLLPVKFRIDGYEDTAQSVIPKYLRGNSVIYDIGGGKNPYMTTDLKAKFENCYVIGIDIDEYELRSAPDGIYDKAIAADIANYDGHKDGDLVICLALLEHVKNVKAGLRGIASCLKSQGYVCIFVPSKNALYARMNLILPERVKRLILTSLFPHTRELHGFPAYYDHCTPQDIRHIVQTMGFEVVEERHYYISSYFSIFFPLYILWRIYLLVFHYIAREQAAETFGMVLKKQSNELLEKSGSNVSDC